MSWSDLLTGGSIDIRKFEASVASAKGLFLIILCDLL